MFQKTEEFEVDGGERENPVEMEFAGGGDPSQAAPISDTGYCFPEGSGRGGLERERGQHCGDRAAPAQIDAGLANIQDVEKGWNGV